MRRHLLALLLAAGAAMAAAHGPAADHPAPAAVSKEQTAWGIAGDAEAARRTIEVRMSDAMRFAPERIAVKLGETVRFVVHNDGRALHEFVIGTRSGLEQHAELMRKHPGMEHDEPYMAHVAPGKSGAIVWTFNRPGEFMFGCLVAGHFEAGMTGRITVRTP
jgi:uncharacterized cupredoxin-like copper-binding protein